MAWRFSGRAVADQTNPKAFAVCDRCCNWFNRDALRFQYDWRGPRLQNLYIMVCSQCYDKPFQHYRPIIVPPDPVPVRNPRPDLYAPQLPYPLTDAAGLEITDTSGTTLMATSQQTLVQGYNMPIGPGGSELPQNVVNQRLDGYAITAPNGGRVILIPEN